MTERNLEHYLGKELYTYQMTNAAPEVGIVRGLAWTSVGGDTLQIEVNVMPGKGRNHADRTAWRCNERVRKNRNQLHPFGKQEHDIQMTSSKTRYTYPYSGRGSTKRRTISRNHNGNSNTFCCDKKKVRADLAMTGEITLRGRVLPIGGLKEKLLAAKNAGIQTVLIPKENTADVEELSSEITKGLEIIPVRQWKKS